MKLNLGMNRAFALAAASVAGIIAVVAAAQAATDVIYKYSTPRAGFYSVDAMALIPDRDGGDWLASPDAGTKLFTNGNMCFNAGVNLPNGAKITKVTVFYSSGAGQTASVQLWAHGLADGHITSLANGPLTSNTGMRSTTNLTLTPTASNLVISNNTQTYALGTCLSSTNNTLYGIRIAYTYTNAGD